MNLTEKPDTITWPETHYLFVQKIGPFQETAQKAWGELHASLAEISQANKISGFLTLYKIKPQMIYCAGVAVDKKPQHLPAGFEYMKFAGGKYARFTLTGSYSNLPVACGKVFEIVKQTNMQVREAFFIENYVNDPKTTPEADLLTEILIPTN